MYVLRIFLIAIMTENFGESSMVEDIDWKKKAINCNVPACILGDDPNCLRTARSNPSTRGRKVIPIAGDQDVIGRQVTYVLSTKCGYDPKSTYLKDDRISCNDGPCTVPVEPLCLKLKIQNGSLCLISYVIVEKCEVKRHYICTARRIQEVPMSFCLHANISAQNTKEEYRRTMMIQSSQNDKTRQEQVTESVRVTSSEYHNLNNSKPTANVIFRQRITMIDNVSTKRQNSSSSKNDKYRSGDIPQADDAHNDTENTSEDTPENAKNKTEYKPKVTKGTTKITTKDSLVVKNKKITFEYTSSKTNNTIKDTSTETKNTTEDSPQDTKNTAEDTLNEYTLEDSPNEDENMMEESTNDTENTAEDSPKEDENTAEESPNDTENTAEDSPKEDEKTAEESPKEDEKTAEESHKDDENTAEESPKEDEKTAEESPKEDENTAEESPNDTENTAEDSPKEDEKTAEESPSDTENTAEDSPKEDENTAEESPNDTENTAEDSPKEDEKTAEESPKEDEKTAEESHKDDENTAEESPKEDEKTAEESPKEDENTVEESPKEDENTVEESPKEDEKTAEESPKEDEKTAEESPKEDENTVEISPNDTEKFAEDSPKDDENAAEESPNDTENTSEDTPENTKKTTEYKPTDTEYTTEYSSNHSEHTKQKRFMIRTPRDSIITTKTMLRAREGEEPEMEIEFNETDCYSACNKTMKPFCIKLTQWSEHFNDISPFVNVSSCKTLQILNCDKSIRYVVVPMGGCTLMTSEDLYAEIQNPKFRNFYS